MLPPERSARARLPEAREVGPPGPCDTVRMRQRVGAPGQGSAHKMAAAVTFCRLLGRTGPAALSLPRGARCFGVRTSPTGEKITHTGQVSAAAWRPPSVSARCPRCPRLGDALAGAPGSRRSGGRARGPAGPGTVWVSRSDARGAEGAGVLGEPPSGSRLRRAAQGPPERRHGRRRLRDPVTALPRERWPAPPPAGKETGAPPVPASVRSFSPASPSPASSPPLSFGLSPSCAPARAAALGPPVLGPRGPR